MGLGGWMGCRWGADGVPMRRVRGVGVGRCFGVLSMLYSDSLRKMMQNGGLESFWGGLGVEFEAKYIFNFRVAPRGRGGSPPLRTVSQRRCGL